MIINILKKVAFWKKNKKRQNVEQIRSKSMGNLSAKKQEQLQKLCEQLFKKKEFITSGKLQFIGLSEIKKKMGRKWEGLCQIVYEIADSVIDEYLELGDVFIRYKDDTYIIIFAFANLKDSNHKTTLIAEEIQKRLFALEEEDLRNIEIKKAISEINTGSLMATGALDDIFGALDDDFGDLDNDFTNKDTTTPETTLEDVTGNVVSSESYKKKKINIIDIDPDDLKFAYVPLWDTKRGALTTYLCLASHNIDSAAPLADHRAIYEGKSFEEKVALDQAVLRDTVQKFDSLAKDALKFFIVCPVDHQTLYNTESYEQYKEQLSKIPESLRKYLFLLIIKSEDLKPPKNPYWFAKPLRTLCPSILAEVPLRDDINFNYLNNSGVTAVGVRLDDCDLSERDCIHQLDRFASRARALKISQTFVLGVTSLSITTSAVCSGFDYLGGSAIHPAVEKPSAALKFQGADLLKNLKSGGA